MALAFATVAELLARIDARYVRDLTTANAEDAEAPTDEVRIQAALDDASAELRTYFPSISVGRLPAADGMRVHCIKVATYLLTLDRPGKEFEQIRNAYTDTIAFYRELVVATAAEGATPIKTAGCAPELVFSRHNLKGF